MALLGIEGFDAYLGTSTNDWCASATQLSMAITAGGAKSNTWQTGRSTRGQAIRLASSASLNVPTVLASGICTADGPFYVGFACYLGSANVNDGTPQWHTIAAFGINSTHTTTSHINLQFSTSTGEFRFYRPLGTNDFGTETSGHTPTPWQTWVYLEMGMVMHATTGTLTLLQDGVSVIAATGLDTSVATVGTKTTVNIGSSYVADTDRFDTDYDDWYIGDDQFYGPCYVSSLTPTADDTPLEWTPSTGANYATVDELPLVTTDYNQVTSHASIVYEDILTTLSALPYAPANIYGVTARFIGKAQTSNATSVDASLKRAGTTYRSASPLNVAAVRAYYTCDLLKELDPSTAAAWTQSGVEACGIGYRTQIDASANTVDIYATHLQVLHSITEDAGGGGAGAAGLILVVMNG